MLRQRRERFFIIAGLIAAVQWAGLVPAAASCNQIPGTVEIFRGASGSVNRPFAGPGEFIELRPGLVCHPGTAGFEAASDDHVISLVFTPTVGPSRLIVIAADCSSVAAEIDRCSEGGAFALVECVPHTEVGVGIIERDGERRLQFRMPDTDRWVDGIDDDRTLTGPATIAVTRRGAALPCELAQQRCRDAADLPFCVDQIFALDGSCEPTPHPQFTHFTVLPPPNDFQALCVDPSPPCRGDRRELRLTTDADGNVLLPVDWRGVLIDKGVSVARLLRASTALPAFPGSDTPIRIPGRSFLRSFSPTGGPLPPVFEPQLDPSAPHELTLFGSADAAQTVLWLARRSATGRTCHGGELDGLPCNEESDCPAGACGISICRDDPDRECAVDSDCAGGECGAALFDFATRASGGTGTVVVEREGPGTCQNSGIPCASRAQCDGSPCVTFRLGARDPVPLAGLIESPSLFVSVVPEAIAAEDLNGDGDRSDNVTLLHDRRTGLVRPIGDMASVGRATTRLNQPPFVYPVVAVEDDVVAFLEAEPLQGDRDANGDRDRFDSILRVFRSNAQEARSLTGARNLVVEPAPLVAGRSLAISEGLVFFRTGEAAESHRRIRRVSVSASGAETDGPSIRPVLSADGQQLSFESQAPNLSPDSAGSEQRSYLQDLRSGRTLPLNIESSLSEPLSPATSATLSRDGRYVAAVVRDRSGVDQIFVQDRDTDEDGILDESDAVRTSLISINSRGEIGERDSRNPTVSADGRVVAFNSRSNSLIIDTPDPAQNEVHWRALVHDRDSDGNGTLDDGPIAPKTRLGIDVLVQPPSLSEDGSTVVFSSVSDALMDQENRNDFCINLDSASSSCADPFVAELGTNRLTIASLSSAGEQGNNASSHATLSAAGNIVAFDSGASNLVAGDTNGVTDVFLRDRSAGWTERISVASDGTQANGSSAARPGSLSGDGRFVVFASDADNLVAGDDNRFCRDPASSREQNCTDVFRHDRLTGFTERISIADDGSANGRSSQPFLSADGEKIAFQSNASNLVTGDTNDVCDEDLDGIASENCSDIFLSEPDPASGDLNGDGDVDDTVLRVLDTRQADDEGSTQQLSPADAVEVAAGRAIYLVHEASLPAGSDRNDDGDSLDHVAHLFSRQHGEQNLQLAVTHAVLSATTIAMLVSEHDQGDRDRNGDGDTNDAVLCVAALDAPKDCQNVGAAADDVRVAGDIVAFLTPESAEGVDLNQDGDRDDRVLQLYDRSGSRPINTGKAVEDIVLGVSLLAFRTSELAQGATDLNGDGDHQDAVLQVIDLNSLKLFDSGQAATPCRLEACDPRQPYRVLSSTVRFLTLESEQGADLNEDGDRSDLLLRTLALPAAREAAQRSARNEAQPRVTTLGSILAGICSDSGLACVSSSECSAPATCYLPPGRCVEDLGSECRTDRSGTCGEGQFCVPGRPGFGSCHISRGSCTTDRDCSKPARCQDAGSEVQQVIAPFASNAATFTGAGLCVEKRPQPCSEDRDCDAGEFCAEAGDGELRCHRHQGSCRSDDDCPGRSLCQAQLITAVARDSDADEVPDPFDNCPLISNPDQADRDGNDIGDRCETTTLPSVTPSTEKPTPVQASGGGDNGGCQLQGGGKSSAGWALLAGIGLALVRRHRLRRHAAVAGLLLAVVPPTGPATAIEAPATCAADCDASGEVSVEEILQLVNAALGAAPLGDCLCADADNGGSVTVDELLAAVNDALQGCAGMPPLALARNLVSLIRSFAFIPSFALPVSLAISGAGPDPGPCPIGGGFASSCNEIGNAVRIPIEVIVCEADGPEGRATFNGSATVAGYGSCPDVLLPGNIRVKLTLDGQTRDLQSKAGVDASFGLDVLLRRFLLSAGTCRLTGAEGTIDGDMRFRPLDSPSIDLSLKGLRTIVRFEEFREDFDCEPGVIEATVSGPVRSSDGGGATGACTTTAELRLRRERRQDWNEIDGRLASTVLGGAWNLETLEPLATDFGDLCIRGGELRASNRRQSLQLRFAPDGSLRIEGEGVDEVLDDFACGECGDGRLAGREECDDGNLADEDGCSALCVIEPCHECGGGDPSRCAMAADGTACDDLLDCTGSDRCRDGACSIHSKACLFVADRFAARVFAIDPEVGGARMVSDRNLLKIPAGIVRTPRGELLIANQLPANPPDAFVQDPVNIVQINPRSGRQRVLFEPERVDSAGPAVAEQSATFLLASPLGGGRGLGEVLRIDPYQRTATKLLMSPTGARGPKSIALLSADEALITYLDSTVNVAADPGHLFLADLRTGEQQEIELGGLLNPESIAKLPSGEWILLDNGLDSDPDRLLKIDPQSGQSLTVYSGDLSDPHSLLVGPDGTLFVTGAASGGGRIFRLNPADGSSRSLVGPDRVARPEAMLLSPVCGNGTVEPGEDCDDGNLEDGDACSTVCLDTSRLR